MKFTLWKGIGEFASTFREWHYLVGGFALGVVVGVRLALRWTRAYHETARRP